MYEFLYTSFQHHSSHSTFFLHLQQYSWDWSSTPTYEIIPLLFIIYYMEISIDDFKDIYLHILALPRTCMHYVQHVHWHSEL